MDFSDILFNILSYSKDTLLLLALLAIVFLYLVMFTGIFGPML